MKTISSDRFHVPAASSRSAVYKHWRNWRTGVIIETVHKPDEKTEIWWDKEFEAVVLFHKPDQSIVFCDPLTEVLKMQPRHHGCIVIRLEEFNRLKEAYGGENTHGKNYYRTKDDLTFESLLTINMNTRRELVLAIRTMTDIGG